MSIDLYIPYISFKELLVSPFGLATLVVAAFMVACVAAARQDKATAVLNKTTAFFVIIAYAFLIVGSLAIPSGLVVIGELLIAGIYVLRLRARSRHAAAR